MFEALVRYTPDYEWGKLANKILKEGIWDKGHKTRYMFLPGESLRISLNHPPLLLGRKVPYKLLTQELDRWIFNGWTVPGEFEADGLMFYKGVCKEGQHIPYGRWQKDYLWARDELLKNPSSKKVILELPPVKDNSWYPGCIRSIQFFANQGHLYSQVYIRSSDVALGLPCDIWQMGQLTATMASDLDLIPEQMDIFIANAHIYEDHIEGVKEQLLRPYHHRKRPEWDYGSSHQVLENSYNPFPKIDYTFHK